MVPAEIRVGAQSLPLRVQARRQARRMTLRLCVATRTVKLVVPMRMARARALDFIAAHGGWLERQVATRLPPPVPFCPGARIAYRGGELILADGDGRAAVLDGDVLRVPGTADLFAGRVRRWLVAQARRTFTAETRRLAMRLGRNDVRVRLGDPGGRWGSCAAEGRIAYSWRLIMAPDFVWKAVVAHEVAHLAEHHHGPAFWKLAEELLGESHGPSRAWLAAHGGMLHAHGAVR